MPSDRGTALYCTGGCRFALLSLLIDAPVSEAETDLLLRQCAACLLCTHDSAPNDVPRLKSLVVALGTIAVAF